MTNIIETTDLNALLDSLTDGETVKTTWIYCGRKVTVEGAVYAKGAEFRSCHWAIRWNDGEISSVLTSFEVTRGDLEVTATRDDEGALHALLDSLEDGQEVTAEWCNSNGSATITGKVSASSYAQEVRGYFNKLLRWGDSRELPEDLHSVTVRRPVVLRWER